MTDSPDEDVEIMYGIEEKPPRGESMLLGIQHILAAFLPNLAPALVIAGAVGLATGETTFLVQMALVFAGVATIVQNYPVGPVGARLPIVMGTSFTFVGGLISIGTQYSLAAVFGACLVGSFVEAFIGWKFEWFESYFSSLVNSIIVIIIGLYLIPVGIDYLAGGAGSANYGAPINLAIGGLVFVIAITLNQLLTGYARILSLLVAIVVGYVAAFAAGMVNFAPVAKAGWFAYPVPFKYGIVFKPLPIVLVSVLFVVTAMENVGHLSALTALENREPTVDELEGGLLADGLISGLAAVFGAFPNTSFAQNIGVVTFTGIMSRFVVAIGGVILILLGFIPKIGALLATMPAPVLGGVTLVMFGMVFSNGILIIKNDVPLTHRNMVIIAASLSLGLGIATRPEALSQLPEQVQMFFGEAVVMAALVALLLDNIIPENKERKTTEQNLGVAEPTEDD
jgi:xanthine permease